MSKGQIFKYFVKIGKQYFGTNSKSVADQLAKGGKRVPKSQVPSNATVKKAPTVPNPRSSSGAFTKPQPVTNPRTTTPTTRPSGSRPAPSTTSGSGKSPSRPKIDRTPATNTKKPSVPANAPGGARGRYTGGRGRKKAPLMPKNMVRERPNLPPKPLTNRPGLLRDSVRPEAPEISTIPPKREDTKKGTPSKRLDKKGETPKKKTQPKKTEKKKTTPKGPMSLREYLNAQIKKRGSSVTAEKKGAEKYSSIAAAKKAGSLYYKNKKTGKIMAAVYKEDLKR